MFRGNLGIGPPCLDPLEHGTAPVAYQTPNPDDREPEAAQEALADAR